jgi:hypothetical protein
MSSSEELPHVRYLVDVLGGNLSQDQLEALEAANIRHRVSNPAPFIAEQLEVMAGSLDEAQRRITDIIGYREFQWWTEVQQNRMQ